MKRCSWLATLVLVVLICGLCSAAWAEGQPSVAVPQPLASALPYLAKNPATVGWLKVGDIVDTPVVRGEGTFYLNHNFFREKATGGTIFIDEENSILPRSENMVVYGHNMRNGSVFGSLSRYRELSYLKKYPIVEFDTIYEEGEYVVVAVYDMSAETEDPHFMQMLYFDFIDNEDFWTFFDQAQRRNIYDIPVDVNYGDHLLTLITCSYTLYDGRLIVMCRELREGEDAWQVTQTMQSATLRSGK